MTNAWIHDRGRGPEIIGTRITVFNLMPYFLDPAATEAFIGGMYALTPEQVAAARAYVLNHWDEVIVEHRAIEARLAKGNPPEVLDRADAVRERFQRWRAEHGQTASPSEFDPNLGRTLPTFRKWPGDQTPRPAEKS